MNIKIIEIINDKIPEVLFSTIEGSSVGIWVKGNSDLFDIPIVGKEYYVEIEIKEVLRWGETIVACTEKTEKINYTNNIINIYGILEEIEDDLVATIRLGESIFLVETSGTPIENTNYVKIAVPKLYLYNTN